MLGWVTGRPLLSQDFQFRGGHRFPASLQVASVVVSDRGVLTGDSPSGNKHWILCTGAHLFHVHLQYGVTRCVIDLVREGASGCRVESSSKRESEHVELGVGTAQKEVTGGGRQAGSGDDGEKELIPGRLDGRLGRCG